MLRSTIRFSIDNAPLIVIVSALLIASAAYVIPRSPVDVFPELNAPTVVILTEAPGYAADEVEQYVTFPIESAVNGLPGVRRVRSGSAIGLSIVWVEFDWGQDIYRARYLVSERLAIAQKTLPDNAHSEITPVTSLTGEIMLISLSAPEGGIDDLELRAYAEFELRNRLLAVPGVSQVVAIGGELPEYQVNVKQDRLLLYGLSVQDVVAAARQAHSTAGAGYLTNVGGLELPLRQTGRVRSAEDIRNTVLRMHKGAPLTIGQVAEVKLAGALKRGTGSEAGRPAVILSIQKAPRTNTLAMTRQIDEALDEIEASLKERPDSLSKMAINRHVMRQSDFIELSLDNVIAVARDAVIVVALVLMLFLLNVRTTAITLVAIPMSIAITLLLLRGFGETINVMTLGGLAVAIGVVVDDGIIFVENIYRRLKENERRPENERLPHARVVLEASHEILGSVVFATLIIVIVFVPLLFLEGLEGRFFQPLGITYMISIGASLLVAITVTAALSKLLLRGKLQGSEQDGFLVRGLKKIYRPALDWVLTWRKTVMGLAAVATVASLLLASTFGTSFLPEFNEGSFTVFLMAPPGTSLEESDRLARGVDRRLSEIEGVRSVVRRTGRAERDEHAEPVSNSEIDVAILPGYAKHAVRAEVDKVLAAVPGITTTVGQPIEHRLSHILSGTPAAIAINVYGDDLAKLRSIAQEIEAVIKPLPGARDVAANREVMIRTLPIRYRHNDLRRWGLTPAGAAGQVKDAVFGATVAEVNEGVRRYDLVVRLAPDQRDSVEDVRRLLLKSPDGALVRLQEVADIGTQSASNLIARENAQRKAVVSCNVAEGYNLGHLVEQVRERVIPIVRRHGYTVKFGGQFEAQQSASRTIGLMGLGVIVILFLLLNMAFNSSRAAALVMVNLPLATIGGIVAIFLSESGNPFTNALALMGAGGRYVAPVISIASLVGFVTLFGIAVRNGILLVNHYQHLMRHEGCDLDEAIRRGSEERLVPILMTALTAVLGLVPLALAAGQPGSELLAPLAIVVLGGLASSTVLNLVVVPAGYRMIFKPGTLDSPQEDSP